MELVVVVCALFTGANIGDATDHTAPSCTILRQLQYLFCWQICPFLEDVTPQPGLHGLPFHRSFYYSCGDAFLQVFIFLSYVMSEISQLLLQLNSITFFHLF